MEQHRHPIELLEAASPTAVVAATGWCPEMAGAVRPFPFIEDGDFRVPAGHVDESTGSALAGFDGRPAWIALDGNGSQLSHATSSAVGDASGGG